MKASAPELVVIGKRMEAARIASGLSRPKFVEKYGGSVRTIENNEKGRNKASSKTFDSYRSMGANLDWIFTGDGEMLLSDVPYGAHETTTLTADGIPAGYVALPLYNDIRAAAGHGAVVDQEHPDDALIFNALWLRVEIGARPQDLCLIHVSGDSMEPTLRAGDVILVNRQACRPDREGIYIVRVGDMLLVKRLQALPGGKVKVTSDNPAFESWTINLADPGADVVIVGRVVWSGRRI